MHNTIEKTKEFHEQDYAANGLRAQRNYPNEELCRFMGRHFFSLFYTERENIHILETGCGSGANLWMIASEGFNAYGLDISAQGIDLCKERLDNMGLTADFSCSSMTEIGYEGQKFDAVIDVFSSHCLELKDKKIYLDEVARVLKPGGVFFSYHPCKESDAFKNHDPAILLDGCTLNGILRPGSAFYKYENSFSFLSPEEYIELAHQAGMSKTYLETVGRTYRNQGEYFEFISAVFKKADA